MGSTDLQPQTRLFKDEINRPTIKRIGKVLHELDESFQDGRFVAAIMQRKMDTLELKDRIAAVADTLEKFLPDSYKASIDLMIAAAPKLGMFENWCFLTVIERHGLSRYKDSLRGMYELTRHASAESAIRPFIKKYTKRIMPTLKKWTRDKDEHIRRLVAEGTRPRGVWVQRLDMFVDDPGPVIELLDKLRDDSSLYVRKAVANSLNDISKDNPEQAIATALRWRQDNNHLTNWIIRHGLRSLIKQGDPRAFKLLEFTDTPQLTVSDISLSNKRLRIGRKLRIRFEVESLAERMQKLAIDYKVHYVKKSGRTSEKVFKLAEKNLPPRGKLALSTERSFANRSVRTHYPGEHRIEIMINGKVVADATFQLMK